jgi:hypothetical protein
VRWLIALASVMVATVVAPAASFPATQVAPATRADDCPGASLQPPRQRIIALHRVAFQYNVDPGEEIEAEPYPGRRLYSKFGLWVRGRAAITLLVDEPAAIAGWSAPGQLNTEVTLSQGDRCAHTGWHVYPGGLVVPKPGGCVRLEITSAARSTTLPFGLRRDC